MCKEKRISINMCSGELTSERNFCHRRCFFNIVYFIKSYAQAK